MKAQPAPIVSGKYFFPKAPLLCLKRIPAWAVTSVNSIGPEGRGGVGLALGDGEAAATSFCGAAVGVADFLQATAISKANEIKKIDMILVGILGWVLNGIEY